MTSAGGSIETRVRPSFAHAALQHLADGCGADLLHVKGVAIDRSLTTPDRVGTDADVLVRPDHVDRLLDTLTANHWTVHTTFATGSPFGHAATLVHDQWGFADVHRLFPGITAEPTVAFERLWRDRGTKEIAGIECAVPSLTGQTLILVLNAARSSPHGAADLETAWEAAPPERQRAVRDLVAELGAEVAFAAATGDLERYRGARGYDLWRVTTQGGTRFEEWLARVKAAPTVGEALRLALRAPLVNTDHLAVMLGRPPTRMDVVREFFARPLRGVREQWIAATRWLRRRWSR